MSMCRTVESFFSEDFEIKVRILNLELEILTKKSEENENSEF